MAVRKDITAGKSGIASNSNNSRFVVLIPGKSGFRTIQAGR
ncbi:MAG: hypothetical protein ABR969_06385 [Sedimentisphaerales bacterium]